MTTRRHLLAALGGAALIPAFSATDTPESQASGPRADYFPNLILETHEGKKVRFYDDILKGKVVVFNMMYTVCTGICPTNTANLLRVHEALGNRVGRDIFFYSLTLRPEMDTPPVLQDYVKAYGIQPGWTFLTGKRADMEIIRRKLGFFDRDAKADAALDRHTGMLRIGNEPLDRWFMAPARSATRQIVTAIRNVAS